MQPTGRAHDETLCYVTYVDCLELAKTEKMNTKRRFSICVNR